MPLKLIAVSFVSGIAATVIAAQIVSSLQSRREGRTALLAGYTALDKPVLICRQWDATVDTVQRTGYQSRRYSQLAARVRLAAVLTDSMTGLAQLASTIARYDMRLARNFYDSYSTLRVALGSDSVPPHAVATHGDSEFVVYTIHDRRVAFSAPSRQSASFAAAADTILRGSAATEFCDEVRSLQIELGTRLGLQ
jgi:hypothetical protein